MVRVLSTIKLCKRITFFFRYAIVPTLQNGINLMPADEVGFLCRWGQVGVCIDRSRFHFNLAILGKTNLTSDELGRFRKRYKSMLARDAQPYTPNEIFLYDTAQLGDKDEARMASFRRGLQSFLGLKAELPPALHVSPGHKLTNETEQALRNSRKIDICDDRYALIREELVAMGKEVGSWIRTYFLRSPDVHVANGEHFDEILESYANDPCGAVAPAVLEQLRLASHRKKAAG